MDKLPWDLQIKIYTRIGIDGMRNLGIKPGKLKVPQLMFLTLLFLRIPYNHSRIVSLNASKINFETI